MLRLLNSEWIKARSIKSTWIIMGLNAGLTALITLILSTSLNSLHSSSVNSERGGGLENILGNNPWYFVFQASSLGLIALMVFTILTVTSEFNFNTVSTTLLATPKRLPSVFAKTVFVALFVAINIAVACLISFVICFVTAPSVIDGRSFTEVFSDGIGYYFGLFILGQVLVTIFAVGFSYIVRNSAAALVIIILITTGFIETILKLINSLLQWDLIAYLINCMPGTLLSQLIYPEDSSGRKQLETVITNDGSVQGFHTIEPFTNLQAGLILTAITVVIMAVALTLFKKRDV